MEIHLAPLKNISCWAFRAGIPGVTDVYTEMIHLKAIRTKYSHFWNKIDTYNLPSVNCKQWIQLLSNNPKDIETLIHELPTFTENNPTRSQIFGFNLNFGCPDPQIIAEGLGACQFNDIGNLKKIVKSYFSTNHPYRLSFKIRIGDNYQDMVTNNILNFLEVYQSFDDPRLSPPIIHFKHAEQTSMELCRWEMLEPILDMEIPIVINGQISSPRDLTKIKSSLPTRYNNLWNTCVKGIMVGRGVLDNPFCLKKFKKVAHNTTREEWDEIMFNLIRKHPIEVKFKKNLESIYHLRV